MLVRRVRVADRLANSGYWNEGSCFIFKEVRQHPRQTAAGPYLTKQGCVRKNSSAYCYDNQKHLKTPWNRRHGTAMPGCSWSSPWLQAVSHLHHGHEAGWWLYSWVPANTRLIQWKMAAPVTGNSKKFPYKKSNVFSLSDSIWLLASFTPNSLKASW